MSAARIRLTPRRRHLAAIITIAVSSAFVAVMVLAGNLISATVGANSAQTYQGVDLVAVPQELPASSVTVPGASETWPAATTYAMLTSADGTEKLTTVHFDPRPGAVPLGSGNAATTPDEIVLADATARQLGVSAGDTLTMDGGMGTNGGSEPTALRVSGIAAPTEAGTLSVGYGTAYASTVNAPTFFGDDVSGFADEWYATLPAGTDAESAAAAARSDDLSVVTADEAVERATQASMSGFASLGVVLLVFVAIALLTTAVVISNTFTVTLAQRTRSLALLRTLGSTRRQVAGIVVRESAGVGLLGAVIGMVAAHVLVQLVLVLADVVGWVPGLVLVPISVVSVLVPVVVGILVTLAAGILPARRATSVAPLQALRPATGTQESRFGTRGVLSLAAVVLGVAALLAGVALSLRGGTAPGILLALGGGTVSFLGVLVGLVSVTRPLARLAGAVVGRVGGLPARIAASNTTRHPGRSAATIGALLIGTTLMTMMAVGAATAQSTLTTQLNSQRPVDVTATGLGLSPEVAADVAEVPGVAAAKAVPVLDVDVDASIPMTVYGIDPGTLAEVSNREDLGPDVKDGNLVLGATRADDFGLTDGERITVAGADGGEVTLHIVVNGDLNMSLATPGTLATIAPEDPAAAGTALLAKVEPSGTGSRGGQDASSVVSAISSALSAAGATDVDLTPSIIEKEGYGQILSVLLGITLALLGVAVVVALVGVANTLSLGVVERSGENALLRALGTTRRQMRAMLGWEGILLALIGAVLGIVLGIVYGVLGATSILAGDFPVTISIPWIAIAGVLVLAVAAGWAASVLPGRSAARTAPAAALAAAG